MGAIVETQRNNAQVYAHLSNSLNKQCYDLWSAENKVAHFRVMQASLGRGVDQLSGRDCINFGSNDYLGLRYDERVVQAGEKALREFGSGSGASPLMCGSSTLHTELEERLADWLGREEALLFATGYQANVGALSSILTQDMWAITESGVHASIIDGCRLSGATLRRFNRHRLDALNRKLRNAGRSCWVVAETLYSMEGDLLDLDSLLSAYCEEERPNVGLYIDEAHSIGVFGPNGAGITAGSDRSDRVDLVMGTLSKALASCGGFVAGDSELIRGLRVNSRSLLFSASGLPAAAAIALKAIELSISEPEHREKVLRLARRLREGFRDVGLNPGDGDSQIVPIHIGDSLATVELTNELFDHGIYASAALHPAVPLHRALLRFGVTAAHSEQQIDRCVETVASLMKSQSPLFAAAR